MKTIITLLLLLLSVAAPISSGWAEETSADSKAQARKAFERGMAFYQKDEFDKAIEQWELGYKLIPQPVFLYNIGQAYRLSDRPEKALDNYRRYLKDSPDAKNRTEVEERVAALEKQLAASKLPPLFVPDVPESPEPAPAALAGAVNLVDATPGTTAQGGMERRKKLAIILGSVGGAVVLGVAIGLGVYFGTRSQPTVFSPVTP